jgi:hypothetical protein
MGLEMQVASWLTRTRWQGWDRFTLNPWEVQENFLLQLIRRNEGTAYGRDHNFRTIRTVADYRKQVPIADYERFRPYVERIKSGEPDTLTADPPLMFTTTSGTTGEPKLIPVTKSTRDICAELTKLWYYRGFVDHKGCLRGKVLGLVSPAIEGRTSANIPYGSASGLTYRASPWWVKKAYAIPYEVSEIKNFEAKYYTAMRLSVGQSVSLLATPNPSTILKLVETANRFKDEILADIHDGTLSSRFEVSKDIREILTARTSRNPKRAEELETFINEHGVLRPREYWPELRLIGCWKGGTVGVRLKEFDRWFGGGMPVRDLGYLASEAHMSLPISDNGSAGVLAISSNFYEFIPETEMGNANPTTLTCEELEEGGIYYVILTTAAGLYRYDINDLIRVTRFYRKTPVIEFLRKGRDVTSITGEKLHVNQVIKAMEESHQATTLEVRHYRVFADIEKSRYGFMVEFEEQVPSDERLRCLVHEFDEQLHQLNMEYAQKRQSNRLAPPALYVMKPGWFDRQYTSTLQLGKRDIQFKAQLLSHTPADESEILLTIEAKDGERSHSNHSLRP